MAIRALPAFWWFREGQIGGLARPGWNGTPWDGQSFDVDTLGSWLGKLDSERVPVSAYHGYLEQYADLMVTFLGQPRDAIVRTLEPLRERDAFLALVAAWNGRTGLIEHASWTGSEIHVRLRPERMREEADVLHAHGVRVLVSLTEAEPHSLVQESPLDVHHLPVNDGTPPTRAQVEAFAAILESALTQERPLAAHCLAGVGRTSTMILAGLLLLGESLPELRKILAERNPRYVCRGAQWAFLEELAA